MATSLKYPSVLAESGAGNAWTNLSNAAGTPGGSHATLAADGAAKQVDCTSASFGFAIPAGATINGIVVDVLSSDSGEAGYDLSVLVKKSGTTTETKSVAGAVETTSFSFGSGTDKWTSNWNATDINSNMTLALQFTLAVGARIGFVFAGVGVTVYYTVNGIRGRQFRERGMR